MDQGDGDEFPRGKMRDGMAIELAGKTRLADGVVELGGFGRVPVPVSSPDLFPKTLTLRTYTLLHD